MFDAHATVTLFPAKSGGPSYELPSSTTSLLSIFNAPDGKGIKLGSLIVTEDGRALEPGRDSVAIRMQFWEDGGRDLVAPGRTFELWYGGVIGNGVVDSVNG